MADRENIDAAFAQLAAEFDRQRAARRGRPAAQAAAAEPQPPTPPPPGPCAACRHAERCRAQLLACAAFTLFVANPAEARWSRAPRVPTRARYERIFGE
jgi:hypothetical protein